MNLRYGLLLLSTMATPAGATLVVDVNESTPGTFAISLTTAMAFDTIEVVVDGDVAGGVNLVPELPPLSLRFLVDSGTVLAPIGGVLDSPPKGDIALTYGVSASSANWTAGLADQEFLQFDLLSGVATVSARLLDNGIDIATAQQSVVAAIPEGSLVFAWTLGAAAIAGGGLLKRRRFEGVQP